MPDTTACLGWPFPVLSDPFQRSYICDLATAMDTSLQAARVTADELTTKPAVTVTRPTIPGLAVVVATPTVITFTVADDDPYDMWSGTLGPATDRVYVRPQQSGNWFFKAMIHATAPKATMTSYLIELISFDTAGAITVHAARSESGTMETGLTGLYGDSISALIPLKPGEAVAIRFTWAGAASPFTVGARLEGSLLSMCDKGNYYYEDFEDGTVAGWTASNGTVTSSTAYAAWGIRSLRITPTGGFALVRATSDFISLGGTGIGVANRYVHFGVVARTFGVVGAGLRFGTSFFDSSFGGMGSTDVLTSPLAINTTYQPATVTPFTAAYPAAYVKLYVEISGTPPATAFVNIDQATLVRACGAGTLT